MVPPVVFELLVMLFISADCRLLSRCCHLHRAAAAALLRLIPPSSSLVTPWPSPPHNTSSSSQPLLLLPCTDLCPDGPSSRRHRDEKILMSPHLSISSLLVALATVDFLSRRPRDQSAAGAAITPPSSPPSRDSVYSRHPS